ncbi:lytic transglycosylase domain-containing protein [Kordiimonas sp. SCSIO 12610]|uniref:lytic transglycosylase domain-containing protein n=1 Tax=Kordiimonas sp. SCSIO 12610 TaxID=2829597 RepID=UPI00210BFB5E|nr:lytic transglycosylase domain-containing protein [Kordiimonas sp. SCSIO 12610]UTW56482.1 lytic transglycosylase domain-containing protein [Kordiimonas sp. SCSIO 12610]
MSACFKISLLPLVFLSLAISSIKLEAQESPEKQAIENSISIPQVLSDADIKRYQRIFELQTQGRWKQADKVIKSLDDDLLMGHVQFQRYMHPKSYRSKFSELSGWLKSYADHPSAWRVYRLARKRQGRARAPKRPIATKYPGVTGQTAKPKPPLPRRNSTERKAVSKFKANIRKYIRSGSPDRAEKRYWAMDKHGLLADWEKAEALERVAASYYYKGNDFKARRFGEIAAELGREVEPQGDWIAGLAAWRTGAINAAYKHFDILSGSARASDWLVSAGHFWASRAAYRLGRFDEGESHLKSASGYSNTFYGMIAMRQLGIELDLDWALPVLDKGAMNNLFRYKATKRAIALAELGRGDLADEELRLLWGREGASIQKDAMALSAHMNLPALQMRLARTGPTAAIAPKSVMYPLPDWAPADGFRIDRAFIFAVMRQESDFISRAKSRVGAGGLMQLMPATARFISRRNKVLRQNQHRLSEPQFNMALGQVYMEQLTSTDYIGNDLFMTLAAYNAGPGSLIGWQKSVEYQKDPLLFIESIGFYETRNFIERVASNLWHYRMRLGQPVPSLDAIASGKWPQIASLDTDETERSIKSLNRIALNRTITRAED